MVIDLFQDVPTFVAAVESGGFAAAGRRLRLTRSAVGKAIARLEERLGVRLFQRTTRKQNLTDDGQAFYERCQRAMAEMQAGHAQLDSGRGVARGRLRVSMPVHIGRLWIAPILTRAAEPHPELELEFNFLDRRVDLIEEGFDLGVRLGPLTADGGLAARRLAREATMVYASPGYIEAHGSPRDVADLQNHRAVLYRRNGRTLDWLLEDDTGNERVATPPSRLYFDDLGAMIDAVVSGHGLAWLPHWLLDDHLGNGSLVRLLPETPASINEINAVWPHTPHLPTRVRVAIDALVAGLAPMSDRPA